MFSNTHNAGLAGCDRLAPGTRSRPLLDAAMVQISRHLSGIQCQAAEEGSRGQIATYWHCLPLSRCYLTAARELSLRHRGRKLRPSGDGSWLGEKRSCLPPVRFEMMRPLAANNLGE